MSDVVLGIRLTIDGKDVSGEIRGQAAELQKLGQAAQQSNRQAKSASDEFVSSLKKQADTLGMTRTQTIAYEASQQNLTAAQRQSVAASIQAIDAHERQERMLGRVRIMAAAVGLALVAMAKAAGAAATEAEQTELRLQAVVKATGGVAGLTAKELIDMSSAMQDRLGINDEAIKSSMAVLLTFKEVGRESFGEAMEVAANLSKVMGTDLQSAALQLGKALQDPEQGLTALNRAGVSFNEGQKDTIKYLVATGNQAQAITLVLKLMKEQGLDKVAESMNQGLFKATNTLKNEWDDLLETFGRTTVAKSAVEGVFGSLATYLRDAKSVIEDGTWFDRLAFFTVGYSTPRVVAQRSARVDQPSAQELDDAEIGASGRKVAAARDQVESFLKGFQSDNDKLGAELKKFRALAGNAGLTSGEIAAGEAKIYAKLFKPGEGAQLILGLKDQLASLSGQTSTVDKVTRELTNGTKQYGAEVRTAALAIAEEIDQKLKKAEIDRAELATALMLAVASRKNEVAIQAEADSYTKRFRSARESIEQIEFETKLIGLSNEEREKAIAMRALETSGIDKESDAYQHFAEKLTAAISVKASREAMQKAIEDTRQEARKLDEDLQRGLTDSIFRGFEAGKGFAENFRDSLVNMFKTTILTPVIKWIVSPITGAATATLGSLGIPGLANAAGGGAGGLGGLGSLFSASNLPGMGNPFGGGAFDILGGLAGAGNAVFQNLGVGAGSQFLADIGNFGYGNPLLAAGLNLLAGNTRGALFSGGLGALGTVFGGPVGGLIGSVAGSFLGGFGGGGGGPASFTGIDVNANLSQSGFAGQLFGTSKNSDTSFRWPTFIPGNLQETANAAVASAFSQMTALAQQMGLDPSRLAGVSANVSFHSASHDAAVITQDLVNNLGALTDQMATALMPNLKDFAAAGETATQTLLRLVQVQDQLRQQEASATDQLKGMVNSLPGQLGITSLQQFQNSLKVADTLAPLDRLANAKTLLNDTYTRAMRGDLSAVNAFPNSAQQLLSIGRDTYASGAQYQQLFVEVNRELQDVLSLQTAQQADLLKNIDVSIVSSAQEQTAELQKIRKAIDDMNASLQATQAELRRIAV